MTDLLGYIVAALGLVAGVLGYGAVQRGKGKRDAKSDTALHAAERYAKQRKDMDDAENTVGDDPAAARRWLRERGGD